MAVASDCQTIEFFSLPELALIATNQAHVAGACALAFSSDGRLLASGGTERQAIIWDPTAGTKLFGLPPQESAIFCLAFEPAGIRLAISGVEEQITIWNIGLVRERLRSLGIDWAEPALQPGPGQDLEQALAAEAKRKIADLLQNSALLPHENEEPLPVREKSLRELLEHLRTQLPADDPQLDSPLVMLTQILIDEQKFVEAEAAVRESLAFREKNMPDKWFTSNTRSVLGGILAEQKRYGEAESLLITGYDGLKQQENMLPAAGKLCLRNSLERLVQLYDATGRPEKAADWKQKLAEFDRAEAAK